MGLYEHKSRELGRIHVRNHAHGNGGGEDNGDVITVGRFSFIKKKKTFKSNSQNIYKSFLSDGYMGLFNSVLFCIFKCFSKNEKHSHPSLM